MRLLDQHRQQGIVSQFLMIVQIFVSQGQTIDSLGHQLLHRMLDQIGIPIISEAGGKLAEDPDALLDLPQEQPPAVTGDRSAVELRADLASLLGMKSEDKLVTLCGHKAVAPSWQDLSRQKSYAMKPQPFSIYCEKFTLAMKYLGVLALASLLLPVAAGAQDLVFSTIDGVL